MANPSKKCLKIGLLNARSLNTGTDELLIREEALVPSVTNYRFIHKARTGQRRGGGVGFFIRKGIVARIKQLPSTALEQLWLEVQLPGAIMAIGTAYRPESVSVRDAIDNISESVNLKGHCNYSCLLGDLNINLLNEDLPQ
ncbi:unnamed protein product, partial [Leptidea sinapis]